MCRAGFKNGTVVAPQDVGEDDAGKIRKMNWLPARDSNSDNLLMLLGAHSDFGMSAFVAERQV